jgi:hypothetical protein
MCGKSRILRSLNHFDAGQSSGEGACGGVWLRAAGGGGKKASKSLRMLSLLRLKAIALGDRSSGSRSSSFSCGWGNGDVLGDAGSCGSALTATVSVVTLSRIDWMVALILSRISAREISAGSGGSTAAAFSLLALVGLLMLNTDGDAETALRGCGSRSGRGSPDCCRGGSGGGIGSPGIRR